METTGCQWHPKDKNIILTSGLDGALRLWDLRGEALFGNLINKHVLKIRPRSGQVNARIGATCCGYSMDGKCMIGGATDGTIHIWLTHAHYSRADLILDPILSSPSLSPSLGGAGTGVEAGYVMSVKESPCHPGYLAARYENGMVKLWKYSQATAGKKREIQEIHTFQQAKNVYQMANIEFRYRDPYPSLPPLSDLLL
jgi:WD40 repeat protein